MSEAGEEFIGTIGEEHRAGLTEAGITDLNGLAAGFLAGKEPKDFMASLSDDIRTDPAIAGAGIKDAEGLAKSYINAQKAIGKKRLEVPSDDWGEDDWNVFHQAIGRPDKADGYVTLGENELAKELGIDEASVKGIQEAFHKNGLSPKQAEGIFQYFLDSSKTGMDLASEQATSAMTEANAALTTEWGSNKDLNIKLGQQVLNQLAEPALLEMLDSSGLGNNPAMLKFLHKIGSSMLEDDVVSRVKDGFTATPELEARAEFKKLQQDEGFMKRLGNRGEVGHKEAVAKWTSVLNRME